MKTEEQELREILEACMVPWLVHIYRFLMLDPIA